jgi:iron complex outermembrane receptor protein
MRELLTLSTASALAVILTLPAYAQDAEEEDARVDTIVVTAQKREQNIQDVPVAVTAFSGDDLRARNVIGFEEIARQVPGLQFENDVDIRTSRIRIRGITSGGATAGTDSSVGVYVDEVYLGQGAAANTDLFDLERVEVLRGPQGTLFGRNTLSGVINMTSKRPDDVPSGYVEAEYGNYNHVRLKGRVSAPLVADKLSASLSGVYFDRDGFIENEFLGTDTNDQHNWGVRLGLYFTPTERMDWIISADYREVDQKSKTYETLINDPASIPGAFGALLNDDPFDRKTFGDFAGNETLEAWGISVRGRLMFDDFDIVNVTGFRAHDYFSDGESDLTPFGVGRNQDGQDVERFTQELRIESTGSNRFNYILGAFYLDQDSTNVSGILLQEDLIQTIPVLFGTPPVAATELTGGSVGVTETDSFALFGSISYEFTDRLAVILGGRQTWEDRTLVSFEQTDFESVFGFPLLASTGSAPSSEDSYDAFTPSVTLKFDANEDVMLYATASKGFRSGGFNDSLGDLSGISFGPETLWNYEGGIKSTWFDDRLLFNGTVFLMEWDDIQLAADDPTTPALFDPRTINAGRAESTGFEIETVAVLSPNFTIDASYLSLDAEYKEGTLLDGTPLDRIPGAADYTFSLNGTYVQPVGDRLDLTVRAEYYHQGDVALDANQTRPEAFQDSYGLFGGRIALAPTDERWEVALWGKNLLDEDYNVDVFDLLSNPFVGQYFNALGAPKTYGAAFRINF